MVKNMCPYAVNVGYCKQRIMFECSFSRKLAKLAGVTLAIARFLSTGCKS